MKSMINDSAEAQRVSRERFIELWLQALESGVYKQGTGNLKFRYDIEYEFCCLGVACDLAEKLGIMKINIEDTHNQVLPNNLSAFMGINNCGGFVSPVRVEGTSYDQRLVTFSSLTEINDRGVDFKRIAQIIREQMAKNNFEKP